MKNLDPTVNYGMERDFVNLLGSGILIQSDCCHAAVQFVMQLLANKL